MVKVNVHDFAGGLGRGSGDGVHISLDSDGGRRGDKNDRREEAAGCWRLHCWGACVRVWSVLQVRPHPTACSVPVSQKYGKNGGYEHQPLPLSLINLSFCEIQWFDIRGIIQRYDWLKITNCLELRQKTAIYLQSQRRVTLRSSNHGILPNDILIKCV